jgi:hypothetical protein
VGVTNGRLEGMQEENKGVSLERQVGGSNVQEEKQARIKWLTYLLTYLLHGAESFLRN